MTKANDSPRLLVWPKTIERGRRRKLEETGWVLGWKDDRSLVCAGILNSSKTLQEYQQMLRKLKEASPCSCATGSLEIIASWSIKKANAFQPGLPVITNERGYPWLDTPTDDTKTYQLLYYSIYPGNSLAHLASEYGVDNTSGFSLLLHRINHAKELLQLVQSGNIPKLKLIKKQKPTTKPKEKEPPSSPDVATNDDKTKNVLKQMRHFAFTQSLVLQHFYQITAEKSFLDAIPAFRCGSEMQRAFFSSKNNRMACTCSHCNERSIVPSRSKVAKARVDNFHRVACSVLDMIIGSLAGILLYAVWRYFSNVGLYHIELKRFLLQLLLERVEWLEHFPAGFKLNVKLTNNLGQEIRNMIHLHEQFLNATLWDPQFNQDWLFPSLAAIGVCFGWTGLLAVMMDLTRLELVHTVILASCFRNLYRTEWYLLSSLWRLFRGKKRNVLRQRTDSMQYDSMQLLVGTIAFCICIFLWTTILVYYTFFMVWNISMHVLIVSLWVLYMSSRSFPWASLWFRSTRSNWFAKNVHSQLLLQDDNFMVSRLVAMNHSHFGILVQRLGVHVTPLLKWMLDFCLEALIPRSSNAAPCSLPLVTLLKGVDSQSDEY